MHNVSGAARLLHDVVEESDIAAATFVRRLARWSNFACHRPLDELVLPEDIIAWQRLLGTRSTDYVGCYAAKAQQ